MGYKYITIDGGTTNTRISYVSDNKIFEIIKLPYGSNPRDKDKLLHNIFENVSLLMQKYGDVDAVLGCGMLTSEYGLKNVPHIFAPAGIEDFHNNLYELNTPKLPKTKIYLIPGYRSSGDDFLKVNIMRGEETELIGLIDNFNFDTIYILPGSHSKIIKVNQDGKICFLRSFMTGELRASLSRYTILNDSINLNEDINDEYLKLGYEFTSENGINESLLKVRTMDILFHKSKSEIYSFFMGCVLQGEINEIIKSSENRVVIGGQSQLKRLINTLLTTFSNKEIILMPDEKCECASIYGMIKIFEYKGQ